MPKVGVAVKEKDKARRLKTLREMQAKRAAAKKVDYEQRLDDVLIELEQGQDDPWFPELE